MAIAGAVVVPAIKGSEESLKEKLDSLDGVDVQDIGEKGIAIILEAEDSRSLKKISKKINEWDEVIDFQLAYLNWEEVE
jgi:nitrate reductase NapAB chaperone NapD